MRNFRSSPRHQFDSPLHSTTTWMVCAAMCVCATMWSTTANAQSVVGVGNVNLDTDKQVPFPMHLSAGVTNSVGSGTFATPFNPTVQSSLFFQPTFVWKGQWVAFAQQSVDFEWTDADANTFASSAHALNLNDTVLALRYQGIRWPEIGLTLGITGSYRVPISLTSRQTGSMGTLGGAVRAVYFHDATGLGAYAGANAGYNMLNPGLASRFADGDVDGYDDRFSATSPQTCITRAADERANYGCSFIPRTANWSAGTGINWFHDVWYFALDFGFQQLISAYESPDDQFTAGNAVPGRGHLEFTSGNLSATWIPVGWLFITGGISSRQFAMTDDGKNVRFPFWDFLGPYNNNSSVYLDTSIQF